MHLVLKTLKTFFLAKPVLAKPGNHYYCIHTSIPPHAPRHTPLRYGGSLKRSARAVQLFGRVAVLETHTL